MKTNPNIGLCRSWSGSPTPPAINPLRTTDRSRPTSEQGVALILTLAILSLVTLMVIAFAVSMRIESMSARNYNDLAQARQFALGAIDAAVGEIRRATPAGSFHVTGPGRAGLGGAIRPLYSTMTSDEGSINANAYGAAGGHIGGTVYARWVNIGTNGQPASSSNPLYGRYAWYVDDEATKVNLNTAFTPQTNGFGTNTSSIALEPLFITNYIPGDSSLVLFHSITNIRQYATNHTFRTPQEWVITVPWVTATNSSTLGPFAGLQLDSRRITVWGHDPNRTPWGQPRFNLNLLTSLYDPINVSANILADVASISNRLVEPAATWLRWFSTNFSNKYNVSQLAANIIDFLDTNNIPVCSSLNGMDTNTPTFLGLELTPYLSEVAIINRVNWYTNIDVGPPVVTNLVYTNITTFAVELWNPYSRDWNVLKESPLTRTGLVQLLNLPPLMGKTPDGVTLFTVDPSPLALTFTGATVFAQNCLVVEHSITNIFSTTNRFDRLVIAPATPSAIFRFIDPQTAGSTVVFITNRIDHAILPRVTGATRSIDRNPTNYLTCVSQAPLLKPVNTNWANWLPTPGTLGSPPGAPTYGPRDDGDTSSLYTLARNKGRLESVGELGAVHVGNVAWRTLRFGPLPPASTGEVLPPDWAILDLFSAGTDSVITGRVNLNVALADATGTLNYSRSTNLWSVLFVYTNMHPISATITASYLTVASSIARQEWVTPSQPWRPVTATEWVPNMYNWVGEICEVTNVSVGIGTYAIGGRVDNSDTNKEAWVRAIANLVTTRSSAFKILAVAQTIKKVDTTDPARYRPDRGDFITGQVTAQAVVERDVNGYWRLRYFRFLESN